MPLMRTREHEQNSMALVRSFVPSPKIRSDRGTSLSPISLRRFTSEKSGVSPFVPSRKSPASSMLVVFPHFAISCPLISITAVPSPVIATFS